MAPGNGKPQREDALHAQVPVHADAGTRSGPLLEQYQSRWQAVGHDTNPALSEDLWNWLQGRERLDTTQDVPANGSLPKLRAALRASDEAVCLHAAYALAAMGAPVVPALIEVLREEAPARYRHNAGRSRANPAGGNPSELYSAQALSVVGAPAVAALSAAMNDGEWAVRAAAADTLGNIGARANPAIPALLRALGDESTWVRRNALEALGTIGCAAEACFPDCWRHCGMQITGYAAMPPSP